MLRQAIGDAFRVTRNTPWTSFAIVLTLSLGTGLNAAVLALTYGIFFRPLPYRDPAALVQIDQEIPLGQLQEWQARLRTVDRVAAFASAPHVLRGIGAPHSVRAAFVSDEFFEVLGVQAGVGRTLGSSTGPAGVMLSRRAASVDGVDHEAMLGRPLTIAGLSLPVLGIMPASVSFPSDGTELWIPASAAPAVALRGRADNRRFRLLARVKPGATPQQVSEDARRVRRELASPSNRDEQRPVPVETIQEHMYGGVRPLLAAFLAGAGLVLVVAAANVATLLLGRAATRERGSLYGWHSERAGAGFSPDCSSKVCCCRSRALPWA